MRRLYKILLIILLPLISYRQGYSQTKSIEEEFTIAHFEVSTAWFMDFVEASGNIYALDIFNDLYSINLETNDTSLIAYSIEALTKNLDGDIVVATTTHGIKKYVTSEDKWETIGERLEEDVYSILVDSINAVYAVTLDGIFDMEDQKYYRDILPRGLDVNNFLTAFMGIDDNIWLWYRSSRGDWSVLNVFDTKLEKTQTINTNERSLNSQYLITSFFNSEEDTYMTAQNHEYLDEEGFIVAFDDFSGRTVFKTERAYRNKISVGPGTFHNNKIYYLSRDDIYEGDINEDLQQEENWEIIAKLPSREQFEKAEFADFNPISTKLIVRDDRIIILRQARGIVIIEGTRVRVFD